LYQLIFFCLSISILGKGQCCLYFNQDSGNQNCIITIQWWAYNTGILILLLCPLLFTYKKSVQKPSTEKVFPPQLEKLVHPKKFKCSFWTTVKAYFHSRNKKRIEPDRNKTKYAHAASVQMFGSDWSSNDAGQIIKSWNIYFWVWSRRLNFATNQNDVLYHIN
jgi:hypothetical protein